MVGVMIPGLILGFGPPPASQLAGYYPESIELACSAEIV